MTVASHIRSLEGVVQVLILQTRANYKSSKLRERGYRLAQRLEEDSLVTVSTWDSGLSRCCGCRVRDTWPGPSLWLRHCLHVVPQAGELGNHTLALT